MFNKNNIDMQAEKEGVALCKQRRYKQSRHTYISRQTSNYNKNIFDKLFSKEYKKILE